MPIWNRDWYRDWLFKGKHPPTCTCVNCTNKRLSKSDTKHSVSRKDITPIKIPKPVPVEPARTVPVAEKDAPKKTGNNISNWVLSLLLIFALSVMGLGITLFIGNSIPFWICLGFSTIYSVEKWFIYVTRKHKGIGKLYRLFLNLSILSLFGLIIWSGIRLFSQQFVQSSLAGSLVFLGEFVFFIWMWRVVSKNSWRWPSMKLTIFSLLAVSIIFAFAGVQPMSSYKDGVITKWDAYWAEQEIRDEERLAQAKIDEQKRIKEQKKISEETAAIPTPLPKPILPKTVEIIPTVPTKTLSIEEVEKEAFSLINQEREKAGLMPTLWDDNLYSLSKAHTEEMANKGELFHTPMGASYAENAWGASWGGISKKDLASRMVNSWMSSPLHRAWILHIPLRTSVVSIVDDNRGQYASWTFRFVGDGGPPLIQKAYDMWMSETGGGIPWLTWLYDIKGYPSNTSWLIP